jgi:hypothetical protein
MCAKPNKNPESQKEKFLAAARELETDDREAAFDSMLKRVAMSAKPQPEKSRKPAKQKRSRS